MPSSKDLIRIKMRSSWLKKFENTHKKQLLGELVWSRIIKVEVGVISRTVALITLTETLIIPPEYHKTSIYCNCFIIHCFKENNHAPQTQLARIIVWHYPWKSYIANASYKLVPNNSGALARAKRSTMDKKIWYTIHPSKFGFDVSVLRPSVRTLFGGDGRESGVSPSGGGLCGSLSAAGHRVLYKFNK